MSAYGDSGDDGAVEDATAERRRDRRLLHRRTCSGGDAARRPFGKGEGPQATPTQILRVLSNRADLISGGDALVEVVVPEDVDPPTFASTVDGGDVTSAFAIRADGTFSGLVDGLALGENEVVASTDEPKGKTKRSAAPDDQEPSCERPGLLRRAAPAMGLRPAGGDAGRRHDPRYDADRDRQLAGERPRRSSRCELQRTAKYTYWYQPATRDTATCTFTNTGATRCFEPYNLAAPPAPADIADFTNDRGDTVKSIVRVERGTMNRGIYELVTLYDPTEPNAPWAPQKGWNGKLFWIFGASSGVSRFQTPAGTTTVWNNTALRRGFMVAASSLTDHGTNANDTLAAETMVMLKERIAETYGADPLHDGRRLLGRLDHAAKHRGRVPRARWTGSSRTARYPDTFTTAIEVMECGLLGARYYTTAERRGPLDGAAGRDQRSRGPRLLRRLERRRSCRPSTRERRQLRRAAGRPRSTFDKVLAAAGASAAPPRITTPRCRGRRSAPTASPAATRRSTTSASSTG